MLVATTASLVPAICVALMIKLVCSFLSRSQLHLRLHDSLHEFTCFCHQEAARPHLPQNPTDDGDPLSFFFFHRRDF